MGFTSVNKMFHGNSIPCVLKGFQVYIKIFCVHLRNCNESSFLCPVLELSQMEGKITESRYDDSYNTQADNQSFCILGVL